MRSKQARRPWLPASRDGATSLTCVPFSTWVCRYKYSLLAKQVLGILDPLLNRLNEGLSLLHTSHDATVAAKITVIEGVFRPMHRCVVAVCTVATACNSHVLRLHLVSQACMDCVLHRCYHRRARVVRSCRTGVVRVVAVPCADLRPAFVCACVRSSRRLVRSGDVGSELVDADLCRRVLQLMQAMDMRLSSTVGCHSVLVLLALLSHPLLCP